MLKDKSKTVSDNLHRLSLARLELFNFNLKDKSYPASGWQRCGCWFLDCLLSLMICFTFMLVYYFVVVVITGEEPEDVPIGLMLLSFSTIMLYRLVFMILFKQTLAQRFLQIYVTNYNLGPTTLKQNLIKYGCSIFCLFGFYFLMVLVTIYGDSPPVLPLRVILVLYGISCLGIFGVWVLEGFQVFKGGQTTFDRWTKTQTLKTSTKLELEAQQLQDQVLAQEREIRLVLETEMADARQMQISLLPESDPIVAGLNIAGRSIASKEVGGDFFDYLEKEDKLLIAVGDVSGKGLKGAMNAVMAGSILNLSAKHQKTASAIMSEVNSSLCESMEQDMNVTMILAQFDIDNKQMTLVNAGQHAYPLLKRGTSVEPMQAKGLALGMIPSIPYKPLTLDLQSGDMLLLMTDGITEPRNAEGLMYEESGRFHQVISRLSDELTADQVIETIIKDVIEYMVDEEERDDDITLVAIKVT